MRSSYGPATLLDTRHTGTPKIESLTSKSSQLSGKIVVEIIIVKCAELQYRYVQNNTEKQRPNNNGWGFSRVVKSIFESQVCDSLFHLANYLPLCVSVSSSVILIMIVPVS